MATCSRCGRTMSIWQRDLTSGLCPRCRRMPPDIMLDPAQRAIATFQKTRQRKNVCVALWFLAALVGLLVDFAVGNFAGDKPMPIIAAVVFLVGLFALAFWGLTNWRCPACERWLGKTHPKFCPFCGVRLRESEETTQGSPHGTGDVAGTQAEPRAAADGGRDPGSV